MQRILITGFEPFNTAIFNPSWPVAQAVTATLEEDPSILVVAAELACSFGRGMEQLEKLIGSHAPDLVICLGLAEGRAGLTVERVAVNLIDARIPDNDGAQPIDVPVAAGGPDAYLSALPLKRAVAASLAAGIPAAVSMTAGTFVCNAALYSAVNALGTSRAVFIHVPLDQDHGGPLTIDQMAKGATAMVLEFLKDGPDAKQTAGTEY